jgi:fructokinase
MAAGLTARFPLHAAPIYPTCHNRTVILFGEILADIFPDKSVLGGAPFNVARHLKAFDLNPVLISRVGNDELRDRIMDVMHENRMETLGVQCNKIHPTGRVQVMLEATGHHFEILPEQAYDFIHPSIARMTTLTVNPSFVYFGTLAQRSTISERALKIMLRSTSAPKFLDLNLRAPWYDKRIISQSLQQANIIKLNREELDEISGMLQLPGKHLQAKAENLLGRFDLDQMFVTCGEDGAWYLDRNGNFAESGKVESAGRITDTVGAGDGFAAVCLLGLMLRWPVAQILERANAFAAQICKIRGAIPDSPDFYQPFIGKWG